MSYASPAQRTQEGLYQADIDALQFLYGAPGTDFDGVESLITTMIEYSPAPAGDADQSV